MKTTYKCNVDEMILKIIGDMQPISSKEIWCEIGENVNLKEMLSQMEIRQRLERMENDEVLERLMTDRGSEKYIFKRK